MSPQPARTARLIVSVVVLLAATPLAGCGDDDPGPASTPDQQVPSPDAAVLDSNVAADAIVEPDGPVPPEVVPSGEAWVVWESTRVDGASQVFKMKVDPEGEKVSAVQQLTTDGGRAPRWSPDGAWIAYQSPELRTTHLMRPGGGEQHQLFDGSLLFWMNDGSGKVACQKGDDYYLVDPQTGDGEVFASRGDFAHFKGKVMQPGGVTHDGRYMVVGTDLYRYGHKGDNGTFTASFAAAIVDLTAKDKVYFFGYGCAPRTPPAGDYVYHVCGDCPTYPDVYRMHLSDLMSRASYEPELAHSDPDWGHSYAPRIANDNKWLVYMATTGCHDAWTCDYEVFIHRLGSDPTSRTRMTFNPANDRAPDLFVGSPPLP